MPSSKRPSEIKNKHKREQVFAKERSEKAKEKLKRRMKQRKDEQADPSLKEERLKENTPKTLDNTRELDETVVEDDPEVFEEEETDEFASYFQGLPPKILVTTSRRPSPAVYDFATEFVSIFPTAQFIKRGSEFDAKKLVDAARKHEFTDLMIINEDRKQPSKHYWAFMDIDAITMVHLPNGPTAYFKLSSIKLSKEINGHGKVTAHKPELIMNNFQTRLGHTVGRFLASLFPQVPDFQGRQVATFHNQRDFIFFRRHRYIFRDGKRCDLQELGPRFTLKLKWLQKGTFDTKQGDFEWVYKPDMQTSRRRFFL